MQAASPLSLRDRRRAETWSALHEAAASMALDNGIENVTIEAIADRAGVSPRTFFNYFSAKEDAMLGLQEPVLEPEVLAEFSVGEDLLDRVARLLLAVIRSTFGGDEATRHALIERYPQLLQRRMQYVAKVEGMVREVVAERLADTPGWADGVAGYPTDEVARMLVMLGSIPMRFSLQSPHFKPGEVRRVGDLEPAIHLLHAIQRKLS
jgi:AcrR family transcriptional regulator